MFRVSGDDSSLPLDGEIDLNQRGKRITFVHCQVSLEDGQSLRISIDIPSRDVVRESLRGGWKDGTLTVFCNYTSSNRHMLLKNGTLRFSAKHIVRVPTVKPSAVNALRAKMSDVSEGRVRLKLELCNGDIDLAVASLSPRVDSANVTKLIELCPNIDAEKAAALLASVNNDVSRAVDMCITKTVPPPFSESKTDEPDDSDISNLIAVTNVSRGVAKDALKKYRTVQKAVNQLLNNSSPKIAKKTTHRCRALLHDGEWRCQTYASGTRVRISVGTQEIYVRVPRESTNLLRWDDDRMYISTDYASARPMDRYVSGIFISKSEMKDFDSVRAAWEEAQKAFHDMEYGENSMGGGESKNNFERIEPGYEDSEMWMAFQSVYEVNDVQTVVRIARERIETSVTREGPAADKFRRLALQYVAILEAQALHRIGTKKVDVLNREIRILEERLATLKAERDRVMVQKRRRVKPKRGR